MQFCTSQVPEKTAHIKVVTNIQVQPGTKNISEVREKPKDTLKDLEESSDLQYSEESFTFMLSSSRWNAQNTLPEFPKFQNYEVFQYCEKNSNFIAQSIECLELSPSEKPKNLQLRNIENSASTQIDSYESIILKQAELNLDETLIPSEDETEYEVLDIPEGSFSDGHAQYVRSCVAKSTTASKNLFTKPLEAKPSIQPRVVLESREEPVPCTSFRANLHQLKSCLLEGQISMLSFSSEHCALLKKGVVEVVGNASSGMNALSCLRVPKPVALPKQISYISCGGFHTMCISNEAELFAFGKNDKGQLGIPTKHNPQFSYLEPVKVPYFEFTKVNSLACGEAHTLVLTQTGKVFSFGWGEHGQLGIPKSKLVKSISEIPREVEGLQGIQVVKVGAGLLFSGCLSETGQVLLWGNGTCGQLGQGEWFLESDYPVKVDELRHEFVKDLVCGKDNVVCESEEGVVYGWGRDSSGRVRWECEVLRNFDNLYFFADIKLT